jgi:teichuronic acid biosynthesis glycosyltransferase TuaC
MHAGVQPSRERQGADVLIVTNLWPTEAQPDYGIFVRRQVESVESLGVKCDVLFVEGYRHAWEYVRAAARILRLNWSRARPRLVHGHGGETSLIVRCYLRGPVLVSYCGSDLLDATRPDGACIYARQARCFLLRHYSRFMTATITKSAAMAAVLPAKARRHNVVLPNGVNRNLFRPCSRDGARAGLGWPFADRIVLFAADPNEERKRYWLARLACAEAERCIGPIRLEVASGMEPDTIPLLMAAADCLLLTSSIEGSPNVVKEAITCGLPVISTDVGDVHQVLAGVEPSWICAARPPALAAALVECLSSRRRSNGWQQAAWLGQDQIAKRLLDLYGSLVPVVRLTEPTRGVGGNARRSASGTCQSV